MNILLSSEFIKSAKKYQQHKRIISKRVELFKIDPFSRSLKTHKLSGEFENYYAFSVNYTLRIIFRFVNTDSVLFVRMGTHEIYK